LGLGVAACLASGLFAGDPIVEVQPGSAKKPGATPTGPAKPASPVPDRYSNLPSLGSGVSPGTLPDAPVATPYQPGKIDPELRRQLMLQQDKKRNWLIENAAKVNTKPKNGGADDLTPDKESSTDSLSKISMDRLRRATERKDPKADRSKGEENPDGSRDNDTARDRNPNDLDDPADDAPKPKPAMSQLFGKAGDAERAAKANQPSLAHELFASPTAGGPEERQRERMAVRGAEFDQMLGGINAGPAGASALDFGRSTSDRSRQFESLLSGPDPVSSLGGGSPLAAAALAPRPNATVEFGRVNAIQLPSTGPGPAPAALPKAEPRPLFLPIPTRGL
jgi:hypothetical protein